MKMYFFKYTGGKLLDYFKISKEDTVIIDESDLRQATKDIFYRITTISTEILLILIMMVSNITRTETIFQQERKWDLVLDLRFTVITP